MLPILLMISIGLTSRASIPSVIDENAAAEIALKLEIGKEYKNSLHNMRLMGWNSCSEIISVICSDTGNRISKS